MSSEEWLEIYIESILDSGVCKKSQWKKIKIKINEDGEESEREMELVARLLKAIVEDETVEYLADE